MTLSEAIRLATDAHEGQTDKGGAPYILHPLRVMLRMKTDQERIVAVLHDVLEDSKSFFYRIVDLGLDDEQMKALEALTRRGGESYTDYILRVRENPLAKAVKLADLNDNLSDERLAKLPEKEALSLSMRYRRAYLTLLHI